jgi:hypothetical protein
MGSKRLNRRDAKVAALEYQIGPKSVITFPSGDQRLPGKGFYEISGLAWSGGGAVKLVEVSTRQAVIDVPRSVVRPPRPLVPSADRGIREDAAISTHAVQNEWHRYAASAASKNS